MASSFIPQRIKRAKQQITVKLYQDQLAMRQVWPIHR
jgi:hypothetical protein